VPSSKSFAIRSKSSATLANTALFLVCSISLEDGTHFVSAKTPIGC
jgi:hypothetical protein